MKLLAITLLALTGCMEAAPISQPTPLPCPPSVDINAVAHDLKVQSQGGDVPLIWNTDIWPIMQKYGAK